MDNQIVGKVTATERQPSTCTTVRFWVHRDVLLAPFDVIKIEHIGRDGATTFSYAIVQELEYITDSVGHLASYVSSDFGQVETVPFNQRIGTTVATAEVIYNTRGVEMPIRDGAQVHWADADGIRAALGMDDYEESIPAGYIHTSNGLRIPVDLNLDYLIGPEGAHLNISGISGLSTKTSYAMFLLNALQQRIQNDVTIIIFNVKGRDLLSLDRDSEQLSDGDRQNWEHCGLAARPFENVRYLYPFDGDRRDQGYTNSRPVPEILEDQIGNNVAHNYHFEVERDIGKLPFLFSDIDDPGATMESIAHEIAGWDDVTTWEQLREQVSFRTQKGQSGDKSISVMSWRKFNRLLRARTDHGVFCEAFTYGNPRQTQLESEVLGLTPGQVLVIDIEPLPDYLQRYVVGNVIHTVYSALLGDIDTEVKFRKVVVFADELNKYAPRSAGATSALTQNMLEITERGRSLGMVLFAAEQFRSGVHDRVLGNCGTNVFGRTSPVEMAKCPDYRYFPRTYQSAATRLEQGTLLIQHAVYKTALIKINFPRPSYYQPK